MPRFHVVMCDTSTAEIDGIIVQARHPVHAALQHPWIAEVYKESYIQRNFAAEEMEECAQKIFDMTSWSTLCVNLDEKIMNALNGGDSSVSLPTSQD